MPTHEPGRRCKRCGEIIRWNAARFIGLRPFCSEPCAILWLSDEASRTAWDRAVLEMDRRSHKLRHRARLLRASWRDLRDPAPSGASAGRRASGRGLALDLAALPPGGRCAAPGLDRLGGGGRTGARDAGDDSSYPFPRPTGDRRRGAARAGPRSAAGAPDHHRPSRLQQVRPLCLARLCHHRHHLRNGPRQRAPARSRASWRTTSRGGTSRSGKSPSPLTAAMKTTWLARSWTSCGRARSRRRSS